MDESYTMGDDEEGIGVVVDVECRSMSPRWPNPLYSVYYKKILKAYGLGLTSLTFSSIILWTQQLCVAPTASI
jgi:hypothetical protein